MPELSTLIRDATPIDEIAAYLDALDPEAREAESVSLVRSDQARLFEKAADAAPSRLVDFVPTAVSDRRQVIHRGRNTVATIRYFQSFEKRFARPENESALLYGYNVSKAFFIHPGYFVAYETEGSWTERGGLVIDYHRIPEGAVPDAWPKVVPNDHGLQKLVYYLTRDFMRRVSAHMTIGRAAREDEKGDHLLDYWFTLCRRDPEKEDSP